MNTPTKTKFPVINPALCTLCYLCTEVCPSRAITDTNQASCAKCIKYCMESNLPCKMGHLIVCYDICDSCGKCAEACPEGAINMQIVEKTENSF